MTTGTSVLGSDATAASSDLDAAHLAWWHDYWSSLGLIEMSSSDGTANYFQTLRTIYLFLTAAENRGTFPGTQAGLADLFDYLEDTQPWYPAGYWVWNLRMQVAANMSSGAFAMNTPFWYLYQSNVANIQAWTTSQMGGRNGLCVPETMRFNGNGTWYDNAGGGSNASCCEAASPSYNALTITSGTEIGALDVAAVPDERRSDVPGGQLSLHERSRAVPSRLRHARNRRPASHHGQRPRDAVERPGPDDRHRRDAGPLPRGHLRRRDPQHGRIVGRAAPGRDPGDSAAAADRRRPPIPSCSPHPPTRPARTSSRFRTSRAQRSTTPRTWISRPSGPTASSATRAPITALAQRTYAHPHVRLRGGLEL